MKKADLNILNESTYRALLRLTKSQYTCLGFEVLDHQTLPNCFAIVRHDVDMSPERALALARIEAEEGVRATYTILMTGEFYNPFEAQIRDQLKQISALGHDIGLHFDAAWHGIENETQLEERILWETAMLNTLLSLEGEKQVQMFSFHNTTPFTMACKERFYGGLRNAYAGVLQDHVQYTSDSNGYWIYRSWHALLNEKHDRIQVLTHPEWWTNYNAEAGEKVSRTLTERSAVAWANYRNLLRSGKRTNKMGIFAAPDILVELWGEQGEQLLQLWLNGHRDLAAIGVWKKIRAMGPIKNTKETGSWNQRFETLMSESRAETFKPEEFDALLTYAKNLNG